MLRILDDIETYSGERLTALIASLPQWRREVALRHRHEGRRRESALAFRLLQDMLAEGYGITEEPQFVVGEHGKPRLANHDNMHFNISHCPRAVACAVGSQPVGVDIERTGRYTPALARHVMCDDELRALALSDAPDTFFTTLWTRKEALFKLLGSGITDNAKTILCDYDGRVLFNTVARPDRGYVCTQATFK